MRTERALWERLRKSARRSVSSSGVVISWTDADLRAVSTHEPGQTLRPPQADVIENPDQEFGRAHYEQHMRTRGTVTIDGETAQIDGTGLRDHSWGPRYWQAIHSYRWLTCTFGPDLGIMVSEITREQDGPRAQNGVVIRGEGLERGDKLVLEGSVVGYIPLRNRRAGMITHIGEGMTEYRLGDRTALGISEYLDQVQ